MLADCCILSCGLKKNAVSCYSDDSSDDDGCDNDAQGELIMGRRNILNSKCLPMILRRCQ